MLLPVSDDACLAWTHLLWVCATCLYRQASVLPVTCRQLQCVACGQITPRFPQTHSLVM